MGLLSGLTLQMDLIVLRNSIFCHFFGPTVPSLGPDCSERGPYQPLSGCGIEELSSASNQTMRRNERERVELRRRERRGRERNREGGVGIILQTLPLAHKPHTHTHTSACTCSRTHKRKLHALHMDTQEYTHCIKFAREHIDAAPTGQLLYTPISSVIFWCSEPMAK